MSFFYDFLDYFKVNDLNEKVSVFAVLGTGIVIMGKFTIINLDPEVVELKSGKTFISVHGQNLEVKSIARGEVVLTGKLIKVEVFMQNFF